MGPSRHGLRQLPQHPIEPVAAQRRDRQHLAHAGDRLRLLEAASQTPVVDDVDLVEREDRRHASRRDGPEDEAIARAETLGGVQDDERGVDLREGVVDGVLHTPRERVERLLKAWQVEKDDLTALQIDDARDTATRRLRVIRDDAHLTTDEPIDEGRLADVGPTEDGYEP